MATKVLVCECDCMPGMHPRYTDCDYQAFSPSEDELVQQATCRHPHGPPNSGVSVFDGVCMVCGKVVNEAEAIEAMTHKGS